MPTGAPQNVAVQAATASQLDVTWEPPPAETQNGDIQGYKVPQPVTWELALSQGSGTLGVLGRGWVPGGHRVLWELLGALGVGGCSGNVLHTVRDAILGRCRVFQGDVGRPIPVPSGHGAAGGDIGPRMKPDSAGMQPECHWDAAGLPLGCNLDAARMLLGCSQDAAGMRLGCSQMVLGYNWDAARMLLRCNWDAARLLMSSTRNSSRAVWGVWALKGA